MPISFNSSQSTPLAKALDTIPDQGAALSKPDSSTWGQPLLLNGKNWFQIRSGPEVAAFKTELNQIVAVGRTFIKQNAATGRSMESALNGLAAFENGKVNCSSSSRALTTFGLNRQNLARFVKLLGDESIPMDVRSGAAVELFGSLGTCPEGEGLRIEEQTAKLGNYGKGLSTRYKETKEQLIDQALTQLVSQEYSWQNNYNKLEIHHVNALKNMHSAEWGVNYREDRYSKGMVQDQCGDMAKTLINTTVTPNRVSTLLTDQIRDVCMGNLGVPDTFAEDGRPTFKYQKDKVDQLDAGLKAEFGESINLNDVLDFSDDYSEVTLKASVDIQRTVLAHMQKEGVVKADVPISKLMEEETPSVADALRNINHHFTSTGTMSPAKRYAQTVVHGHSFGHFLGGMNAANGPDARRKDEEEKRLRAFHGGSDARGSLRGLQNQALGLGPKSSTPENKNPAE